MPRAIKEDIVDSLEAYKNKGYTSIAEADYNEGFEHGFKQCLNKALNRILKKARLGDGDKSSFN